MQFKINVRIPVPEITVWFRSSTFNSFNFENMSYKKLLENDAVKDGEYKIYLLKINQNSFV